nr:MAG TPA: hypothetical protein [Caudoviricetes sp.]
MCFQSITLRTRRTERPFKQKSANWFTNQPFSRLKLFYQKSPYSSIAA